MTAGTFTEQVALVMGGGRGIGWETATAFAAAGGTAIPVSRSAADGGAAMPDGIVAMRGDASNPASVRQVVDAVLAQFGRIDLLVNNVGGTPQLGPVLNATEAQWDATMAINLRSAFTATKAVVNAWMGAHGGAIVNVASIAGLRAGGAALGIYGVAKAGLIMLTKQLARELAPQGIRVNAVAPGVIQTAFSEALWANPGISAQLLASTPNGRFGTVAEVAAAILFLGSDAARHITGDILSIDGGSST